jgi:hypothetical protein
VKFKIRAEVTKELEGEFEADSLEEALFEAEQECSQHGEIEDRWAEVISAPEGYEPLLPEEDGFCYP